MQQLFLRLAQAVGLLLLLVFLTSALLPAPGAGADVRALAVRQIGHDYLISVGDSTSRIPVVVRAEDGSLSLRLSRQIDYDTLSRVARRALLRYGVDQRYTLALEDCGSGEVFLGSQWSSAYATTATETGAACTGRDQEERCGNVRLRFLEEESGLPWPLLIGLTGFLLFMSRPLIGYLSPVTEEVTGTEGDGVRLSPNCDFDALAHQLRVGEERYELTYRESKLLTYFADRPGIVLPRQDIHDAVWGEEGIITGRSLDVFVSRLRKKLAGAEGVEIRTAHGIGYQLVTG